MKLKLFLIIAMFLLVVPSVFAGNWTNGGRSYVIDYRTSSADRFKDRDYGNTTAGTYYAENVSKMGYVYVIDDDFEGNAVKSGWSSNTEAVTSTNYAVSGAKSVQIGVGASTDALLGINTPVALTCEGWMMNFGGSSTVLVRPLDIGVKSVELGFPDTSKWYYRPTGGANTASTIGFSNVANTWVYFQTKQTTTSNSLSYLDNGTIREYQATDDLASLDAIDLRVNAETAYWDRIYCYNSSNPKYNTSANEEAYTILNTTNSFNQVRWEYQSKDPATTQVALNFSCNNGTTVTQIGNATTANCPNSQTSNQIRFRIIYNLTSSNMSFGNVTISTSVAADTTPPEILELNMTSEASPYVVNLTDPFCFTNTNSACKVPRTNDTTPTFRMRLSESGNCTVIDLGRNLNYSDIVRGGSLIGEDTSTDFNCVVTLNDANATRIGIRNFSASAVDDAGNMNSTATYFFSVNITDNVPPRVTLNFPTQDMVFKVGSNNTIIFNFSATDNIDRNFTASILIDGTQEYFNNTYLNGTNASFVKTVSAGSHYWNVTTNDSFYNINSSAANFTVVDIGLNISLNEPKNNTLYYSGTNIVFNFTVNFSDSIDKCFLFINNTINQSNKTLITSKIKYNLTTNLTNNDYSWIVGCNTTENLQKNSSFFNLYINNRLSVNFTVPTLANNSITNNNSFLINVTVSGKIDRYVLDWNGTNETISGFNSTLNLLINKTNLEDLTTYNYRVYANDTNGNWNSTEKRIFSTNFIGVIVSVSGGVNLTFRGSLVKSEKFYGNQSLTWAGNNTAIALAKTISKNYTLYNNGTIINQGNNNGSGNYTIDFTNSKITIINATDYFNGTRQFITNQTNFSYNYFDGNFYVKTLNISCDGQNETKGCLNISPSLSSYDINFSLLYNITLDPVRIKIIDDFTDAINWTSFLLRSNNTNNRTSANHSILCIDMTSFNLTGRIRYRFNNTLSLDYLNSTNQSNPLNFTFNCTSTNSVFRILNYTSKNISGFDFLNFSWKGDNTTNTFILNIIDEAGTKVSSSSLTLSNTNWNYTGFSLGSSLKNMSIINISVTNASGTRSLSQFFIERIMLTNSTSNQSQYITMKAGCTSNYANSTVLVPNILTNMCIFGNNTLSNYIWLWQDINLPFKGIRGNLNYNLSRKP